MRTTIAKLASLGLAAALAFGLAGQNAAPQANAEGLVGVPGYTDIVPEAIASTTRQPGSLQTGMAQVVVHINKAPLAVVGKNWNTAQRRAYVQEIRAMQDQIAPQVQALGGTVVGRFTHAAAGLAVQIDRSKLKDLVKISNVLAVKNAQDYALDLTETVPWIGAKAVQDSGITGKGVTVAVIDSGIDYTHAKLGGPGTLAAYAKAYCGSESATPDPTDPACTAHASADTSGYFPNAKVKGGWDWVGEAWPTFSSSIDPDPNPIDFEGHGTHVADIIGGLESSAGAKDKGVAPGADIYAFKACSAVSSSCNGLALLLAVDDALDLDDSDFDACTPGEDEGCKDYDPADVINMSLGSPYGQPEDDLTHFVNIATYYGSTVVVSAGNSGDRPYIVGSPSAAAGAISVAQSSVPSDKFYRITAGSASANGVLQPWSPAPTGTLSGQLQYGDGAGGNLLGCSAFPAGSLTGKVLLVDRGTCAVSIKGANGSAAGAVFVIVVNNTFSNTPPVFSYGGGTVTVPVFTVTQNDGNALKTQLGQTATVDPSVTVALQDDIVASSSRGPRIADGAIKPDIAAPGASVSAEVGTGTEKTAFGGTSGAAPMVSGAAALMVEKLRERDVITDSSAGYPLPFSNTPNMVKAMLMNNANTKTYIGGSAENGGRGFLAPITLTGAGRVDVADAAGTESVAYDVTALYELLKQETVSVCDASDASIELFIKAVYGIDIGSVACLSEYPFGNDYFEAQLGTTGSLSFGYDGVSGSLTETHVVAVYNTSSSAKTYSFSNSFRYSDDVGKGATVKVEPGTLNVAAGDMGFAKVTLTVNARNLRDWTLDAGQFGASGTNIYCNDPNPDTGCPTLTMFEIDGFLKINGGSGNTMTMPWQVLPKKAANVSVTRVANRSVKLSNTARYKPADTDVFALVDISPNNCEVVDSSGNCVNADYVPGILPGINQTAIDIHEVGLRGYVVSGLNAALGLPAAPDGAVNDEVVDFGVTVYDKPYRASHNYPVEFDIYVDANRDGTFDYVVFNGDLTLNAADGRNAVFVADINKTDGTRATRAYFFSFTDFNSQNWILPVPAAAIGVTSNQAFDFFVLAYDNYFTGDLWDCSPFNGGACGDAVHTYQTGLPKYNAVTSSFQIRTRGSYTLSFSRPSGGAAASPSQQGFLFMYRDAEVGKESSSVVLP